MLPLIKYNQVRSGALLLSFTLLYVYLNLNIQDFLFNCRITSDHNRHVCVYECMYASTYVFMYVCMYVCTSMYSCTCVHVTRVRGDYLVRLLCFSS